MDCENVKLNTWHEANFMLNFIINAVWSHVEINLLRFFTVLKLYTNLYTSDFPVYCRSSPSDQMFCK